MMPKISLNGIEINYREAGQGEQTLLLIHNLTSNIDGFDQNVPELAKYYRVVAMDIRGHGRTSHEEDPDKAASFYHFDRMAEDQMALLDHLGINKFWLFGQAYWGANTALHLADRIPERVNGVVISSASMILSDETHKPYDPLGETGRANFLRMHRLAREHGMMAVYQDRLDYGQFWGPKVLGSPEILAVFARAHETTSVTAFVTPPYLTQSRRDRIAATFRQNNIPIMLLVGEDEAAHNRHYFISEMRADIPHIHVMMIPDSGHYPTIENPRDFNQALLDFYAGTAARK
jgi:pimeloyl-ACP methyl ester carboxylesterase